MKQKQYGTAGRRKIKMGVIAGLLLMLCVSYKYVCAYYAEDGHDFRAPKHETEAAEGIPGGENVWNYEEVSVKEGYVVGIDTTTHYYDGRIYLNVTNCAGNTVWFLAQVYREDKLIAETGMIYPGEYVADIPSSSELSDTDSILIRILAYEPKTYNGEGIAQISCVVTAPSNSLTFNI